MKYLIDYKLKCFIDQICPTLNEVNAVSIADIFPQCVRSLPEGRGAKPPFYPCLHLPAKGDQGVCGWISDSELGQHVASQKEDVEGV